MTRRTLAAAAAYIAAIVAANLLVAHYGPTITIVNAFALIGVDLAIRDLIDDELGGRRLPMLLLIATAGAASYALNPAAGRIAAASTAAFVLASVADWTVYRALRGRVPWAARANASNTVGAAVDSLAFPTLAFGFPVLWLVVAGQLAAKIGGGALIVTAIDTLRRRRSVDAQVATLADAYAQMDGRATPDSLDLHHATVAHAAHRIAFDRR